MQNVQNAAEIQQRVINLVELYRTKVGKESKIAKEAKQVHDEWLYAYCDYSDLIGKETDEDWFRHLMINEQLLGHFYSVIAGENADRLVLKELFSEQYDENVFTEEDELFLRNHFKEMVNYIIQTPCNDIQSLGRHDRKDALTIPREVIELIKNRVVIPAGSKVYNPFAGYGQFAIAYPDSHFYCDDRLLFLNEENKDNELKGENNIREWPSAWLKLALFANKINVDAVSSQIKEYDAIMSYLYLIPNDDYTMGDRITEELIKAYSHLRNGGKMILICPTTLCWGWNSFPYCKYDDNIGDNIVRWWRKVQHEFRHIITSEGAIVEMIQLPEIMSSNTFRKDYSILIIEKGRKEGITTMIDARFASKESDRKNFKNILDLEAFDAMLTNEGCDVETGLRKMVNLPVTVLHEDLLIPQTYVVEKPSENEKPIPLSSLCQLVTERVKDVKYDLPLDTPLVTANNLSATFNGALDIEKVEKANCPNNPPHTNEYTFDKNGNFVDDPNHYIFGEGTEKDLQVAEYRQSKFLDGSKDAVLLALTEETPKMALYQSTGNPIAVETHPVLSNKYFHVFCPKDGVDALQLLSILRNPIVYRQLQAYEEFGLYGEKGYLKDVLVPTDKRIINDEINRMLKEQDVLGNLEDSLYNMKRAVRMRKHALTQSLSSLEAMFYALNAFRERKEGHIADDNVISRVKGTTVRDAFDYLSKGLKGMMPVLEHIADVEYTFTKPEWIDPELFIEDFIAKKEKGWLNFKPVISWKKGHNQAKEDMYNFPTQELVLKKGQSIDQFFFPKDALEHVLKNIISNAQAWAFDDQTREDYLLKFSWYIDGKALVIAIENNGTPIPKDRSTSSLLEYGVSTDLHHNGHNGIGCNEIDDIMQRYGGKVEIVSIPNNVFTVKYVLTFNHRNNVRSLFKVIEPVLL